MGLSVAELDDIFGERAFLITQGGHVVTSSTGSYSDWYHLESTRIKLALDIYITDNVVKRFRLVPHAVEQMVRGKTN